MSSRTALITGASAGLGAEFARQLAAAGYNLILVARRTNRLESLAAELGAAHGVETTCLASDLAQADAPRLLVEAITQRELRVDYLINNAGSAGEDLLQHPEWEAHRDFFQLMMLSPAELCHRLIPAMRNRGFGRVINVASVAARLPAAGGCNYGPTKAYLVALSEDLSLTLKDTGVNVCALCPGYTHTDFHETAGLSAMKEAMPSWLWYDADVVIREGLAACEKGKPIFLSGRLYRWLDPLFQSVITRRFFRMQARRHD